MNTHGFPAGITRTQCAVGIRRAAAGRLDRTAFPVAAADRPGDTVNNEEGAGALDARRATAGVGIANLAVCILGADHLGHARLRRGRLAATKPRARQYSGAHEAQRPPAIDRGAPDPREAIKCVSVHLNAPSRRRSSLSVTSGRARTGAGTSQPTPVVPTSSVAGLGRQLCGEVGARPLTPSAGLGADATVLHAMLGVPLALLATEPAGRGASLEGRRHELRFAGSLARDDAAGRLTEVGAVEIEPDSADQHGDIGLAQTRISTGRASLRTVDTGANAGQERVIRVCRVGMGVEHRLGKAHRNPSFLIEVIEWVRSQPQRRDLIPHALGRARRWLAWLRRSVARGSS